ncbi:MAG: DUF1778 domain-containing protein [Eggerthellaceae bacterium]|nr:DUF1778 domain-containing protein [Eggerthellaceae bacterium]
MATMTLRVDETDASIIRKYANFEGKTLSDFIRDAVFEKIENAEDLEILRHAIADDDGIRYTQDDIERKLDLV